MKTIMQVKQRIEEVKKEMKQAQDEIKNPDCDQDKLKLKINYLYGVITTLRWIKQ